MEGKCIHIRISQLYTSNNDGRVEAHATVHRMSVMTVMHVTSMIY